MGFATHLGPWLLGTVKHTTGTTAGSLRNIGATVCSQTKKVNYAGSTAAAHADTIAVLPAGSQIIDILIDVLVQFTTSTAVGLTVGDGSDVDHFVTTADIIAVAANTRVLHSTLPRVYAEFCGAASAAAPDGIGIGSADVKVVATVTPTIATAGAGTVQYTVIYAVRNADGSSNPTTYTGP